VDTKSKSLRCPNF